MASTAAILICTGLGLVAQNTVPAFNENIEKELLAILNTPVQSSTKTSKKISEAPSIISIFKAEDIKRLGARNLADLLKLTTGFYIWTQSTGRPNVWVRGVKADLNSKVMLVIDGVPSREITYSEWDLDYSVPLVGVERVEIIRGPGSALYGGQAYSGVISIFTRSSQKGSEATIVLGNESTKTADASLALSKNQWGFLMSAFGVRSDGYPMQLDEVGKITDKKIEDNGYSVLLKINHDSGFLVEYHASGFDSEEPHFAQSVLPAQIPGVVGVYC